MSISCNKCGRTRISMVKKNGDHLCALCCKNIPCFKRITPSGYMAMLFPKKKVFDLW